MIALKITEIGSFLTKLLKEPTFDHFLLQEASVTHAFTCSIDGTFHPEHTSSDSEPEETEQDVPPYVPFALARPTCLKLLAGNQKPVFFKFVFLLSPENQTRTIGSSGTAFQTEDINGMYIHFTYKNNQLLCTTGISYRLFSLDKSLEEEWDRLVRIFLGRCGIESEPAS